MGAYKKLSPIVTELFIRGRKINISFILILLFYFKVPKTVRLNPTHYFIMQIPIKRELQQPSRHTTSNRQRFNIDITPMHQKENINELPRHFDVTFWWNFDGWKIKIVLTYVLRDNFRGQKMDVALNVLFYWKLTKLWHAGSKSN